MRMSVGVDLHKGQFTAHWRSEDGIGGGTRRYATSDSGYRAFEKQLCAARDAGAELKVAVESTGNTRYFKNRVESVGIPVTVVNSVKFKVVTESVNKTDKRDAATLAQFLEKDMLPEARLCSQESEELRRLLKVRANLVKTIVSVKNQIHGLLLSMGIESKRAQLQSAKERRRVKCELAAHNVAGATVDPLFETIERLSAEVKKIEKILQEKTAKDEVVQRIRTIPGAGLITATTIRAFTDDISRFATPAKYASYAGLAPWVQNSNETVRHGRITKRGPSELRTAMVQVLLGMVRSRRTRGYRLMQRYQEMKRHKGSGRSIIAGARSLSEIIWHMLTNEQPFDEARMTSPEIRRKATEMQAAASEAA